MKNLNSMEPGGYPFDDVSLAYIQSMFSEREAFIASLIGDNFILDGMHEDLQTGVVSEGRITYDGKLYHFAAGLKQDNITRKVIDQKRVYEDGEEKNAFITDFFEFGDDGIETISLSSLKRYYRTQPKKGEIRFILSTEIENLDFGWYLANGENGTIDLRNHFIAISGDLYTTGQTGGQNQVTLTTDQIPSHNHSIKVDEDFGGTSAAGTIGLGGGPSQDNFVSSENKGGGQSHENRPLFIAVVAIQFVGI